MGVDPVWVILDPKAWIDASWEKKLLGAVVRDFYSPTDNRKPDDPSRYYDETPISRTFNDFVLTNKSSGETNVEAKLTTLIGAKVGKTTSQNIDLTSKTVELRRLNQHDEYWERVTKDLSLNQYLPMWIKKSRKKGAPNVCLVVGIAICENVEVEWEESKIVQRKASGEFPLDVITVAAGVPLPLGANLQATVTGEATHISIFKAKNVEQSIFALELKVVETEGWIRPSYIVGRGPKVEPSRELADTDDDDDDDGDSEGVEIEDLALHKFSFNTSNSG
jgi:hypothetical protein